MMAWYCELKKESLYVTDISVLLWLKSTLCVVGPKKKNKKENKKKENAKPKFSSAKPDMRVSG